MHTKHSLCALLVAAGGAASLSAQDLIGVSWSGNVYAIDSTTAASNFIGVGLPGQNAMAADSGGTLWSTHRSGSTVATWVYHLTTIDPVTGTATIVHSQTPDSRGLANGGVNTLLAIQDGGPDQLLSIDTVSGVPTTVGPTGFSSIQALAMHQGTLYAWDLGAGLITIDTTTGAGTDPWPATVGPTGSNGLQWLMSHPDGRLLGGRDTLFVLDTTTGVATQLGVIGSNLDLRGAEFNSGGFIRTIGTACNGVSGPTTMSATGSPQVGGTITTTSINHAPSSLGVLIFGFDNTMYAGLSLPLDLDPLLGTSGCTLDVSIDSTLIGFTTPVAPADLTFSINIPATGAGLLFHLQHAVFEAVPGGTSWSNGASIQIP